MNALFGGVGLLLLIASPVVILWGIFRAIISAGIQVGAKAMEKPQGEAFGAKHKLSGLHIIIAGLIFLGVGWVSFAYLAPMFTS